MIFDDYNAAEEAYSSEQLHFKYQLYRGKYLTRLDDQSKGIVVIVQQRIAEDDLSGRVRESGSYQELILPLVAEEDERHELAGELVYRRPRGTVLEPRAVPDGDVQKLTRQVGERTFFAHYQQRPVAQQGAILKPEWLPQVELPSPTPPIVLSIDTATSLNEGASFSVIEAWAVDKSESVTVIDVVRGRFDYDTLVAQVVDAVARHRPAAVLIEDMNVGTSIASEVDRLSRGLAVRRKPTARKEERLRRHLDRFHRGLVRVLGGRFWTPAFVQEVLSFPSGRYSDQTDAMTQLLDWLQEKPALIGRELITHGMSTGRFGPPSTSGRGRLAPNPMRDPKARFIVR